MKTRKIRQKQFKLLEDQIKYVSNFTRNVNLFTMRKKLSRIRRGIENLLELYNLYETEINYLKNNNTDLARALQDEKERSKSFMKDKIMTDYSYHELINEHVVMKKELFNLEQVILAYDEGLMNSMIPNLVKLSDNVTEFKCKNSVLRTIIDNRRSNESLPRNSSFTNTTHNSNITQQVYPMIKGCVIQKPIISVRRVSFPHENKSTLFANIDISSPIMEEPSEEDLETTKLSRKCKGGLRQMLNLSNRQGNQKPMQSFSVNGMHCSPNSSGNSINDRLRTEPVVRLHDVTRLLQNSSLRIEADSENSVLPEEKSIDSLMSNHYSPEILLKKISIPLDKSSLRSLENPLEGCSWMFPETLNTCNETTNSSTKENELENVRLDKSCKSQRSVIQSENSESTQNNSILNTCTVDELETSDYRKSSIIEQCVTRNRNSKSRKTSYQVRNSDSCNNENTLQVKPEKKTYFTPTLNKDDVPKTSKKFFSQNLCNNLPVNRILHREKRYTRSSDSIRNSARNTNMMENSISVNSEYDQPTSTSDVIDSNESINEIRTSSCQYYTTRQKKKSTVIKPNVTNPPLANKSKRRKKSKVENDYVSGTDILPNEVFVSINETTSQSKINKKMKKSETKANNSKHNHTPPDSTISETEAFNSSNENCLRPTRSLRNKAPVSYKEPSLGRKLRHP